MSTIAKSSTSDDDKPSPRPSEAVEDEYPTPSKRMLIMGAVYMAVFLVTLDQSIVSTAIPRITDEFNSLKDVGWYGTAYILTLCCFQLFMGKLYKFYRAKPLFLLGCVLFEAGSALCGAAPNSTALIIGRAIAGLGSAGMFSGMMVIMFNVVPMRERPIYQGAFGAVFAIASIIGPLLGGVLTDKATWRWNFYINLPIGAVSILVTIFLLHLPNQQLTPPAQHWLSKIQQLDPIGNLALFPGIISLVLALQWGGITYPWHNWRIIVLFVVFGLTTLLFIAIQAHQGEAATVPPRILKQRSIASSLFFGIFTGASLIIIMYYLPLWFQAVKGATALSSGLMLLPMVLATTICTILSGIAIAKIGYYAPFFLLASLLMPIGAGLLATMTPTSGKAEWIGYQVLFGIGVGVGNQQPLNVIQTVLKGPDIAIGSAVVMFTRFLGSAIFLPVAQTVFLNSLTAGLHRDLPAISPGLVASSGATDLKGLVEGEDVHVLLGDYHEAIVNVFYLAVEAASVTILGSVFVEWRSMLEKPMVGGEEKKKPEADKYMEKSEETV